MLQSTGQSRQPEVANSYVSKETSMHNIINKLSIDYYNNKGDYSKFNTSNFYLKFVDYDNLHQLDKESLIDIC